MTGAYMHFSVDDAFDCLRDLYTGAYASPWEQPTLAYLRGLREEHGLVASLYLFARAAGAEWRVAHADARFREELAAASAWLRFGFHAQDAASRYSAGATAPEAAARHHREVVGAIARFAGPAAVDRAPRVHYYTGAEATVRAWQAEEFGPLALLAPDDDREEAYHLDEGMRERVRAQGRAVDESGLRLFRTDVRLERPVADDAALLRHAEAALTQGALRVFTHEVHLGRPRIRARLEALARHAAARGARGAFPLDAEGPAT